MQSSNSKVTVNYAEQCWRVEKYAAGRNQSVPVFARACHACEASQSCEHQACVRPDTGARQAYVRHVVCV
jgi:hypothetical protein